MTREEAIEELYRIVENQYRSAEKDKEALSMAIEALSAEPCEDCISRKALLEEIENGIKAGNYEEGYEEYPHINDMNDIIECVKYAESVQPKPKTGHWKKLNVGYGCSECSLATNKSGVDFYRFCPNCGAKMESEDKE